MVQSPPATNVTVDPATVQTEVVCESKLTLKPELALALTANGEEPSALVDNGPNVIVCGMGVTWKL